MRSLTKTTHYSKLYQFKISGKITTVCLFLKIVIEFVFKLPVTWVTESIKFRFPILISSTICHDFFFITNCKTISDTVTIYYLNRCSANSVFFLASIKALIEQVRFVLDNLLVSISASIFFVTPKQLLRECIVKENDQAPVSL